MSIRTGAIRALTVGEYILAAIYGFLFSLFAIAVLFGIANMLGFIEERQYRRFEMVFMRDGEVAERRPMTRVEVWMWLRRERLERERLEREARERGDVNETEGEGVEMDDLEAVEGRGRERLPRGWLYQ